MTYYISVPVNQDAMKRLDYDECIQGDLVEYTPTESEYEQLFKSGLIEALNNATGSMIDHSEDAVISIQHLEKAKQIIKQISTDNPNQPIFTQVYEMTEQAQLYNTGVFFYF